MTNIIPDISPRKTAIIVGVLILIAYSVMASLLLESSLIIFFLEVISGIAVAAMAVLMFPILKPHNKNLNISYAIIKIIEGIIIIIAAILLFSSIINPETHTLIYDYHAYIFAGAFLLLSYIFYQSNLVPRFISVWGIIGSIIMIVTTLINMTIGSTIIPFIFSSVPVIVCEIFLAIWLIVKGFNEDAIIS